jgi:cobalt-precorrin-5B (C1)-methyltransferase
MKDAGDDPDVTHRARIQVSVSPLDPSGSTRLQLRGGRGVGRVTKPGLPVPVGEAAINPSPRWQIQEAAREALRETGGSGSFEVLVQVPDGERLAQKTMNPRLGVLGGISILGTRGTVEPYSSASYKGTIDSELDVALAAGCLEIGFATGGRSERLLRAVLDRLPAECFVLTADYFAYSLQGAALRGFQGIHLGCFFGKLIKMAQGHPYTHARSAALDFGLLARWCSASGLQAGLTERIASANTAREVLENLRPSPAFAGIIQGIVNRAVIAARGFAGNGADLRFYVFDFNGERLYPPLDHWSSP